MPDADKDAGLEWQAAEGSQTLHVIDTTRIASRRSGPQSLCGKRPQRSNGPWFCLPLAELPKIPPYGLRRCPDCEDACPTPPLVCPGCGDAIGEGCVPGCCCSCATCPIPPATNQEAR